MNLPPVISSRKQSAPGVWVTRAFLGFVGLLLLARLASVWNLPLPFCALKRFTGIPCPFCGSTRCLQSIAHLDFVDALRWNPLTFLAGISVGFGFAVATVDHFTHRRRLAVLQGWLAVPAMKFVLLGAVLSNWIYLCLTLP